MNSMSDALSLPVGPEDAPVVLQVGKAIVACDPIPERPGRFCGHPDDLEPPEEADLGPTYLYLRSKGRWVSLRLAEAPHIESQIWAKFEAELAESWAAYALEIEDEKRFLGASHA